MNHFLSITDITKEQIVRILHSSQELQHSRSKPLDGATVLFSFEKPSLRTVVATEVAITQLGGCVIHVKPENFFDGKILFSTQHGSASKGRESLIDTVKNVSQWCDAIFARVFFHQTLTDIADVSEIPVINALSDRHHPMQALADLLTIQEKFGDAKISLAYIGDANNVAFSLIEILLQFGHDVRFAGPPAYSFSLQQSSYFQQLACKHSASITFFHDQFEAARGADIIYTDTFVSMGEEKLFKEKMRAFKEFQVNASLLSKTGKKTFFMHCLPAHRGVEVTDDVIDSDISLVYRQAKNRMVSAKGVFVEILARDK
ncbi:ornithine carbamoyltransferase [Candidatus Uhrbacteria bacterium]|nr:ornithine carbamoyltransferase [Candidatus Uhrbacteria bacterium]